MNAPGSLVEWRENMEKEMTFEEFKEVLTKAELDFEVIGFEGVLNYMALCFGYREKESTRPYIKELYNQQHKTIHNALRKRGYYE